MDYRYYSCLCWWSQLFDIICSQLLSCPMSSHVSAVRVSFLCFLLRAASRIYCLPHYMGVHGHKVCTASRASNPKKRKSWKPRTAVKPNPEIHADVQNPAFISNGCGIMAALLPADIDYCATSSYVCANHFPVRSEPYPLRSHTSAPMMMVI